MRKGGAGFGWAGWQPGLVALTAGLAGLLVAGTVRADDAAAREAKEIWTGRCVTCHGTTGKGDGAAAVALNPKPRAFGDADWQKSVTDEHIEKIILEGGMAVGKSVLMPGNPDLAGKPAVVKALRGVVRDFGKP